jgi:hypothetical protein
MDLTESEMSELTGEGVGLVYESYQIEMLSDVLTNREDSGPNGSQVTTSKSQVLKTL